MSLPKAAISALVVSLTGWPASQVIWAGDARPAELPIGGVLYGTITLNLTATKAIGDDELRGTAGATQITYEQRAHKLRTISVKCESVGSSEAFDVLEQLRRRLKWPSSLAALNAVECALVDTGNVQQLNGFRDNREISVSALDFRINHCEIDTPPPVDFIDRVTGSGTATRPDGSTTPGGSFDVDLP